MKKLFITSLILPIIYFLSIILFFTGLIVGFDLAELVKPYNELIINTIGILTFSYVGVCLIILYTRKVDKKIKIWWSFILLMLNMLGVPWFLYHCYTDTLQNIIKEK